ncbi:unnamed protein product [Macrosiphum euphorbiae]|uniref:Uncharacterized protein n=1 Tax=Macrosiphum euphorbiae TaxID=13131 RepID=A0AAV0XAF4_9HEMI|nr:unnamed protein product [Macrosiphum euphorbiae]
MAVEAEIETAGSDWATGASDAGPALIMPRKYSNDIGNRNRNNNRAGSRNHIGKSSKINNSVVDILDLAVPQSKVRPIDRLLDRYDWSSASMTQPGEYDHPLSRPGRPAPSPPLRPPAPSRPPPPTPPPTTRPPLGSWSSEFSGHKLPVRKSLWKRARELVSRFFVRTAAAVRPNVDCFWSH